MRHPSVVCPTNRPGGPAGCHRWPARSVCSADSLSLVRVTQITESGAVPKGVHANRSPVTRASLTVGRAFCVAADEQSGCSRSERATSGLPGQGSPCASGTFKATTCDPRARLTATASSVPARPKPFEAPVAHASAASVARPIPSASQTEVLARKRPTAPASRQRWAPRPRAGSRAPDGRSRPLLESQSSPLLYAVGKTVGVEVRDPEHQRGARDDGRKLPALSRSCHATVRVAMTTIVP